MESKPNNTENPVYYSKLRGDMIYHIACTSRDSYASFITHSSLKI